MTERQNHTEKSGAKGGGAERDYAESNPAMDEFRKLARRLVRVPPDELRKARIDHQQKKKPDRD
jgi:hypothetical protein